MPQPTPIIASDKPITNGKPTWSQSTLLWGSASLAATIVLTVVAAMKKDLRWLLILAWPLFCIAVWEFVSYFERLKKKRIVITLFASLLSACFLYGVNIWLKPLPETPVATQPPLPTMTVDQMRAITEDIISNYKRDHNGEIPPTEWINAQLLAQGRDFHLLVGPQEAGADINCVDCTFLGNGEGIHVKGKNPKLNLPRNKFIKNGKGIDIEPPDNKKPTKPHPEP